MRPPGPVLKPSFPASPKGRALPVALYRYQPVHLPRICESKNTYARGPRLLDRVREAMRIRHYSRRTEQTYCAWIRRFILFNGRRHPAEGAAEVTRFLSSLATDSGVSASTQNQALAAVLFLYRTVLELELPWLEDVVRAKRTRRLPVVLSRTEVWAVLDHLHGVPRLMGLLLYGAGLRLMECARLRAKDIEFDANQIIVRCGKGGKDRVTLLPSAAKAPLARHLEHICCQHLADLRDGAG